MSTSTLPINNIFLTSPCSTSGGTNNPSVGVFASLGKRLRAAAPYIQSGGDKTLKEFSLAAIMTCKDYMIAKYDHSALETLKKFVQSYIPELIPLLEENKSLLLPIKTVLTIWAGVCVATYFVRYVYALALTLIKVIAQCKGIRTAWAESISSFQRAESKNAFPLTPFWFCILDTAASAAIFVGISHFTPYFCYIFMGISIAGLITKQVYSKLAACFDCCKSDMDSPAPDPNALSFAHQLFIEGFALGYLRGYIKDLLLLYASTNWEKNSFNYFAQDNSFNALSILSYATLLAAYKTHYIQQRLDAALQAVFSKWQELFSGFIGEAVGGIYCAYIKLRVLSKQPNYNPTVVGYSHIWLTLSFASFMDPILLTLLHMIQRKGGSFGEVLTSNFAKARGDANKVNSLAYNILYSLFAALRDNLVLIAIVIFVHLYLELLPFMYAYPAVHGGMAIYMYIKAVANCKKEINLNTLRTLAHNFVLGVLCGLIRGIIKDQMALYNSTLLVWAQLEALTSLPSIVAAQILSNIATYVSKSAYFGLRGFIENAPSS